MRVTYKHALWLLLTLPLMQGCDKKKAPPAPQQALAPPIVDTPPPRPATVSPADLPPPVVGTPQPAAKEVAKAPEPPKKPVHHPKKPTTTPAAETKPVQEAVNTPPPSPAAGQPAASVPAPGQFSSGASGDVKTEMEDNITATEKSLNGISRTLNGTETKTAAQIREFLKQARDALNTGDADGAKNLLSKAKVLMAELNQ
jgi:hypothetical protein